MSTDSARSTSRGRSRAAIALTAVAGLVTGLTVAAGVSPASAVVPAAVDPACVNADASTAVLSDVAVSPTTIDVRTGAKQVVVTVAASDSRAITRVRVAVAHGRTGPVLEADLTRITGTALDGTWRGTLVVPRGATPGTYQVQSVNLANGYTRFVNYEPSDPGWGAWATSFTVRSVADRTAPRVRAVAASTRAVTTSTRAKKVAFRVRVTDDRAGVGYVVVRAVRDVRTGRYVDVELHRSRTRAHVWVGAAVIPAYVGKGTHAWKLRVVTGDRVGNRRSLSASALAARGWQSTVPVTSRTDRTAPTLAAFTFSPSSVDARTGDQMVTFSIRVTDTQSGPLGVALSFGGPGTRLNSMVITGVTGSARDRTFTGEVLVPQCGASGTYTASVTLADNAQNFWDGTSADLAGRGYATELVVQQLDAGP